MERQHGPDWRLNELVSQDTALQLEREHRELRTIARRHAGWQLVAVRVAGVMVAFAMLLLAGVTQSCWVR